MRSLPLSASSSVQADIDDCNISDDNRALAQKLSGHMGIEGALRVSTQNQWHGVVAALFELQKKRRRS